MNPVISCRDDQFPVSEAEAVIHMDSILNGSNAYLSSGNDKFVICINPVFVCCIQRQRTIAVDRQIVMSKNHTACFIGQSLG